MSDDAAADLRVLILAPERDGELTCRVLGEAGIDCLAARSGEEFLREFRVGVGVLLVAEEVLTDDIVPRLLTLIAEQPAWSDLPVVVVAAERDRGNCVSTYSILGNVSILSRPMTLSALSTAVQSALRARRRQYEVRDLFRERESAARQKDEFLAMLAHELRNPLAPVRTTLQVLKLRHPDNRDTQAALVVAERSVKHLAHLIDDLLDVSRVTLGKFRLRSEQVDARDVIRFAAEAVRLRAQDKGVTLDLDTPDGPLPLNGDPTRLEQAVTNILDNALKYTPAGGTVRVRAAADGNEVVVTVSDTGVGIDGAELPHVFDLFSQGDKSLDRTGGGLGVGLTIVKGLVELHGGRVSIASPGPNQGTTVEIRLPRGEESPAADPTEASPELAGRLKVLVVDDNRDGADSLATFLTLTGCETRTAYDGPEALEAYRDFHPEAVLLDIGLPGMTGYEVAERIRVTPGSDGVMIVAVTGYGRDEDRAQAKFVGFNHHLVKPVDLEAIGRLLTSAVRSGRAL
ncbi:MAG: hybrid sensor histidine kinase/response regulator [Isosphaera sp.]|nr:hybrid sensor histidine kinase/response regulator [Isosphaera sp.]